MKQLLVVLLLLVCGGAKAQTRVMYPEDRTNRIFLSGLTSGITYAVSYGLLNPYEGNKKHLYPILTTVGVNMVLGALSYAMDNTSVVNKRQNMVGWFGGSMVTITIIRIGLN